jgi:DNA-binding NarL/FixJ family response regulator
VERARHVRSDFQIENNLPYVLQICQLVEGMPLALELAACWLKALPCKAIAEEIQQNLNFLNSYQRDLPQRHHSIRAVFEQCWKLLSPPERERMNRLSVFKGGFRREAAEQVAGATLDTLLLLTDKSLLRLEANGRFHIHELVRQYAAEQVDEADSLLDAHCMYYAGFLHRRNTDLFGGRQVSAIDEIAEELDNIQAGWDWAIKRSNVKALRQMSEAYLLLCQFRGRYQDGYQAAFRASRCLMSLEATREIDLALGYLLSSLGWFYVRLGQHENAEDSFRQCEMVFKRLGMSPSVSYALDPSLGQAVIALVRSDYLGAERLAEQARHRAEISHSPSNLSVACRTLAETYSHQGRVDLAQKYAQEAYQICEEANDRWFMAYCLTTLGEVALKTEAYAGAKRHFDLAYALRQEFHDPEGMALVLAYLGDIAVQQQSFGEALRCYDESRTLYQQINDPGGLARALCGLSRVQMLLGKFPAASQNCRKALQIAMTIQYVPVLLQLLIIAGELCYAAQNQRTGLDTLALVANHAAADQASRVAVQQFCAQHHIVELPSALPRYDLHDTASLLQVTANIEVVLLEIEEGERVTPEPSSPHTRAANQPLLDPLSQRELEVLSYIAAGLQNREIADKLVVSLNTVKTHINNIYSKLSVTNRVQAITRARDLGIL